MEISWCSLSDYIFLGGGFLGFFKFNERGLYSIRLEVTVSRSVFF